MGRFVNTLSNVTVVVSDDKDDRFPAPLWEPVKASASKTGTRKASSDK